MAQKEKRLYIVRKIIEASSLEEAIKLEKKAKIDEIIPCTFGNESQLMPAIGFLPPEVKNPNRKEDNN